MKRLLFVVAAIVSTIAVCVWLSSKNTSYPIIFAAPATGVMAFFGILAIHGENKAEPVSDAYVQGMQSRKKKNDEKVEAS
jgi:hypothetical protein